MTPDPPAGRDESGIAQIIHEAHLTMRYSLLDIVNGDTGTFDLRDCPVCTPATTPVERTNTD